MNNIVLLISIGFLVFPFHSWSQGTENNGPNIFNTVFSKLKRGDFDGLLMVSWCWDQRPGNK